MIDHSRKTFEAAGMLGSIWRAVSRLVHGIGWLVVATLVAYPVLLWVQPEPPFRDFRARAVIEYGAAPITIEGSLRCWRSHTWVPFGEPNIPPHGGNSYGWSDVGIAARLPDGSAVVVALHPPCHNPSHIDPFSYPDGTYPVVFWLDKPDRPDRVEAYFDRSGYEGTSARLKLKHVEMTYVGRSVLPRFRATEAVRAVPWASQDDLETRRDRNTFTAYFAVIEPEAEWRKRARAADILSKQETWRRFSNKDRTTYEAVRRFPVGGFSLTCREFRDRPSGRLHNCDAIRNALTVDAQAGRFVLPKGSATTGIAIFVRSKLPHLRQRILFDLLGHEEQISEAHFGDSDGLFYDPDQRWVIALKREGLHW